MRTADEVRRKTARAEAAQDAAVQGGVVRGVILFFLLAAVAWVMGSSAGYDLIGSVILTPILIAVTLPFLRRESMRQMDPWLYRLLVIALLLKLAGALARLTVGVDLYGGRGDAFGYHRIGLQYLDQIRAGNFHFGQGIATNTHFIEILTGFVYLLIGPSQTAGFIFFSWLAFIGMFMFYRAFVVAIPEGNKRTYAKLLFFMPSLIFWPSSIGKEAWMVFTLGLAAYGAARILTHHGIRGVFMLGLGTLGAYQVRPHVAGAVAAGLAVSFIVRPVSPRFRSIAPVAKLVSLAAVIALSVVLVGKANSFLNTSKIDTSTGLGDALQQVASRTDIGASRYQAPVVTSPSRVPLATVTVLFRPTVLEAHNTQVLATGMEGTFLLLYTLVRFRWGVAAIRLIRKRPYVVFALVQVALFIFMLSAFSNFAILARERVQFLPLYLVLFAIPPAVKARGHRRGPVHESS